MAAVPFTDPYRSERLRHRAAGSAAVDRLERLVNLVAALLATDRPLTAEDLAASVSPGTRARPGATFQRAFERDKADVAEHGDPARRRRPSTRSTRRARGYRVRRQRYELPDPGLDA